ncbi:hypothetical protein [Vampirovibrio chlorellavorus]|uniref:hypothetical protein n=1 Tax=Vampirovibrio chlorellavorus TaxID=758823 RepID=UPI0026EFE3F2|nr:hypothetical protein [Vampirovibrio chlorellavorus]
MGIRGSGARAVFSKTYTSPEQIITSGGALTLAHGLGERPKSLRFTLVCNAANINYSIGDEVDLDSVRRENSINGGLSVVVDATNIYIRYGSNATVFLLLNKSTGVGTDITNSNWRLVVRAFA